MDIRDYEYIVAIVECGSVSAAAEQLCITQPALSRFLKRLEEDIGIDLFTRQEKQFILTQAGQKYVETGRVILNLDHQLADTLEREKLDAGRKISIGISMAGQMHLSQMCFPIL